MTKDELEGKIHRLLIHMGEYEIGKTLAWIMELIEQYEQTETTTS